MGIFLHGDDDNGDSLAPTISLGYDRDPGGGFGMELFASAVIAGPAEGIIYGANLSLLAPHGPSPLLRGRYLVGLVYDDTTDFHNEHLGWQTGVRLEMGRHAFIPLVVEVLYRWMKVGYDSAEHSFTDDLSGLVVNLGFGFRFL
jgi:hypothetical protein